MPQPENSHHRLLVGHLPHYYVPKSSRRLTRQDKAISPHGRAIRSLLGYSVVEDLSTGGAIVELYEMTNAETLSDVHSVLFDLTLAWLDGKAEPRLCPENVPRNLWVERETLDVREMRNPIEAVCSALSVELYDYKSDFIPFTPVRSRPELEYHIEQVLGTISYITAHNHDFQDYRLSVAHACSRWLGTQRQMLEAIHRYGTPAEFDDNLELAVRGLPQDWFARVEPRKTREQWMSLRPWYFSAPSEAYSVS